jgi:hypothetical protein
VGGVAGRLNDSSDPADSDAALPDAPDLGPPGGTQNAGVDRVVVPPRRDAIVHTPRGGLAEYGRVNPAHCAAARLGWVAPDHDGRDYRVGRSSGSRLEPHPDPVRMGWETGSPSGAEPRTPTATRWLRSLYASSAPPHNDRGAMAIYKVHAPLVIGIQHVAQQRGANLLVYRGVPSDLQSSRLATDHVTGWIVASRIAGLRAVVPPVTPVVVIAAHRLDPRTTSGNSMPKAAYMWQG